MKTTLVGAFLVMGLSCGPSNNDPSMDLTGTETEPLVSANGTAGLLCNTGTCSQSGQ